MKLLSCSRACALARSLYLDLPSLDILSNGTIQYGAFYAGLTQCDVFKAHAVTWLSTSLLFTKYSSVRLSVHQWTHPGVVSTFLLS